MSTAHDPLARLGADRAAARAQNDGGAAVCMLGTVNDDGDVEQRTLVLRDLADAAGHARLALFFSGTAPKWQQLRRRPLCSIATWMPTIQVQYRMHARWEPIPEELVRTSWQLRPDIPKKLDWLYQEVPQSEPIERALLEARLGESQAVPDAAPDTAMGVYLLPERIERLELSGAVHLREHYRLDATGGWQYEHLVP